MVSGSLHSGGSSFDRCDATVLACVGAVVWRFDVPQILSNFPASPTPQPLAVNEELLMLRALARELVDALQDHRSLLVASETENAVLQRSLQVVAHDAACQTDAIARQTDVASCQTDVLGANMKMEQDAMIQERAFLQQSVSGEQSTPNIKTINPYPSSIRYRLATSARTHRNGKIFGRSQRLGPAAHYAAAAGGGCSASARAARGCKIRGANATVAGA